MYVIYYMYMIFWHTIYYIYTYIYRHIVKYIYISMYQEIMLNRHIFLHVWCSFLMIFERFIDVVLDFFDKFGAECFGWYFRMLLFGCWMTTAWHFRTGSLSQRNWLAGAFGKHISHVFLRILRLTVQVQWTMAEAFESGCCMENSNLLPRNHWL
jgi:hypothetical protein